MPDEDTLAPFTDTEHAAVSLSGREGVMASADPQDLEGRQILDRVAAQLFGGSGSSSRYEILHKLGAGGMGVVYAAHDPVLDCVVALKQLHGYLMLEPGFIDRLRSEARAMARLRTESNVVTLYDFFVQGDAVFVVMEMVEGTTLRAWQSGRPGSAVVEKYLQAGLGLAAAHRAGLVHRDFKPENVLIDSRGVAKVSDFGLARVDRSRSGTHEDLTAGATMTGPQQIAGTPRYMSPEQLRGAPLDARSDQFSFCVALWEALFHEHPFFPFAGARGMVDRAGQGASTVASQGTPAPVAFAFAISDGPLRPTPPTTDVPRHIIDALTRGLRKASVERYPSMDALLAALRDAPVRGRPLRLAGVVACMTAALAWAWPAPPPPAPATRAELEAQAHDQLVEELGFAELADDLRTRAFPGGPHLLGELERYAKRWGEQRAIHAFTLQRLPGDPTTTARQRCLDLARDAARTLVRGLADANASATLHAAELVEQLPAPEECTTMSPEWLACSLDVAELGSDTAAQPVLVALSAASEREAAGDFPAAIERAAQAVRGAEAIKAPLLLGRSNYLYGHILYLAGRSEASFAALLAAHDAVESTGCIDLRANIYSRLIKVTAIYPSLPADRAEEWTRLHRTLAEAVPDAGTRIADALNERGLFLLLRRGQPAAALVDLEQAAKLREWLLGGRPSMDLADTHLNIGIAHQKLGRLADAATALAEATRLRHAVAGSEHPLNYKELLAMGTVQIDLVQVEAALESFDRALVLAEHGFGRDSGPAARAALSRAQALELLNRTADASAAANDAAGRATRAAIDPSECFQIRAMSAALASRNGDPEASRTLHAMLDELTPETRVTLEAQAQQAQLLTTLAYDRDDYAEALRQADRTMNLLTGAGVPESALPFIKALRIRGLAAYYVDDADGAIRDLERVLEATTVKDASQVAEDRVILASTLLERRRAGDRSRACEVIRELRATPAQANSGTVPAELRRICRVP